MKKLHAFMMRHLRSIMKIRWQDKVTNIKVLKRAGFPSMEDLFIRNNLRWTGHLLWKPTDRLPRQVLYSQLTWTVYRRHVKKLHAFMMRHLRSIMKIRWQDKVTNIKVLKRAGLHSMEDLVMRKNLRWTGHLLRMPTDRLPRQVLYSQLTWTVYRRHVKKLHAFMMRHLRSIMEIRWQDKVTIIKVLKLAGLHSMEDLLIRKNLRWTGHLLRMPTDRLPRQVLYSQLPDGQRPRGRPRLRYKDTIKRNLKKRDIDTNSWKSLALQRDV